MTQKTILCYGDSNTWGYVPTADHSILKSRYPRNKRWPGILQTLLGSNYYVVEEGLNSRTTNIDYAVPPDRNGKTYLLPCLYSHSPVDLIVLALGGNDLKTYFNRTAEQITAGLADLVDTIQASGYGADMKQPPRVLITTVVIPLPVVEHYKDEEGILFMQASVLKAKKLIDLYSQLAKEKKCFYLDLSSDVLPSDIDGVHYDENAHRKCAEMIGEKIKDT